MGVEKRIILLGEESQILEAARFKLKFHVTYDVQSATLSRPLLEAPGQISKLARHADGGYDLIVLFGQQITTEEQYNAICRMIDRELAGSETRVLLVCRKPPVTVFGAGLQKRCEVISFESFSKDVFLRNVVDRLLGASIDDYDDRVRICDAVPCPVLVPPPPLPSNSALILDDLRCAHFFLRDEEFRKYSVQYLRGNTVNYEESADRLLDAEYRHLESVEEFHKVLTQNDQRVTYLLMGHRGVGKSSFVHYYFRTYKPFADLAMPYVIVDFKNYGYVGRPYSGSIHHKIMSALYKYYVDKGIRRLTDRFPTMRDLYNTANVTTVLQYLQERNVPFEDVICDDLQYDICTAIDESGQADVGRELAEPAVLEEDDDAIRHFHATMQAEPYRWVIKIWSYIHRHTEQKPFRWFSKWLIEKAFDKTGRISYASHHLFTAQMSDWWKRELGAAGGYVDTSDDVELQRKVESFINTAILHFGRLYIALDNIDQLAPGNAAYELMDLIYPHLALQYDRLKLVVSMRPSTYTTQRQQLDRIEDTAVYYKYWLKKVLLKNVLEKRLAVLSEKFSSVEDRKFIAMLGKLLSGRLLSSLQNKKGVATLPEFIDGLTGNNTRDGLKLFYEMLRSHHTSITEVKGPGLFRKDASGNEYVADHIALRGLCLENTPGYQFRMDVVNLFCAREARPVASLLVQARILEILTAYRVVEQHVIYDYLLPLGYTENDLGAGLKELQRTRLIAFAPDDMTISRKGDDHIFLRQRGLFYYNDLITRLSYAQMVYFMSHLPRRFSDRLSYPGVPRIKGGELSRLVEYFLSALRADIRHERDSAPEDAVLRYEREVYPLEKIHTQVADVYFDLVGILKRGKEAEKRKREKEKEGR